MDVVYAVRPGERNEALRYSLRSLVNVEHDGVWLFGHAPSWVHNAGIVERPKHPNKYLTVTRHIRAACLHPDVSDPFMFWNDDFYAVEPIGPMPLLHRGLLADQVKQFSRRNDEWAISLRATARMFSDTALSYELHAPLIVYKDGMLDAIARIQREGIASAFRRTVYGNTVGLGGDQIADPKMNRDWPTGQWVSSTPATFNLRAKPHLQRLFPASGTYEVASESDFGPSPVLGPTEIAPEPQNGAQIDEMRHQREETG